MLSRPDFEQKKLIFVWARDGEKFSFKNDNLIISDKEGRITHQSTCYRLFYLIIIGNISITSGLLERAKKFGFSIALLNFNLRTIGAWNHRIEGNVLLRKKQYLYQGTSLACYLIENKIESQKLLLKSFRCKDEKCQKAIENLGKYQHNLRQSNLALHTILGIEGNASRVYFPIVFEAMNWQRRRPRVKNDITNFLLDMGYTLLFNFVESLLNCYGFDLYQGVYHKVFYQRKSLVCDIVEPFRPLIDKEIRKNYNLGKIKKEDFYDIQNKYHIKRDASKEYTKIFMRILIKNKEAMFLFVRDYYRSFIKEAPIEQYPKIEN